MRTRIAEKEAEAQALQAKFAEAAVIAEKEAEGVQMSGIHLPSQKAVADAATNTGKRTYVQAAAQTQVQEMKEITGGGKDKGKGGG